jgi:hypothetical protein
MVSSMEEKKGRFCPVLNEWLEICFTQCGWLLKDKCTYDPLFIRELEDIKAVDGASLYPQRKRP